jgi:hypothetical protein
MVYAMGSGNERCNFIGINSIFRQIWLKGAGILVWHMWPDQLTTMESLFYMPLLNQTQVGIENQSPLYGKQFVSLGLIYGWLYLCYNIASGIRAIHPLDQFGTPLDDLPMMGPSAAHPNGVDKGSDLALIVVFGSYDPPACWNNPIGAFYLSYGVPSVGLGEGEIFTEAAYLQQAGVLKGLAGCALGQREYEALVMAKYGTPNVSWTQATQILYAGIFIIVAMIVNNYYQLVYKKKRGA